MFEGTCEKMMSNLKSRITDHLTGRQKAQVVATKDVVCMLALGQSTNNQKGLAKVLGVDRWNIHKTMDQWIQLDTAKDAFWITSKQEKHSIPYLNL